MDPDPDLDLNGGTGKRCWMAGDVGRIVGEVEIDGRGVREGDANRRHPMPNQTNAIFPFLTFIIPYYVNRDAKAGF